MSDYGSGQPYDPNTAGQYPPPQQYPYYPPQQYPPQQYPPQQYPAPPYGAGPPPVPPKRRRVHPAILIVGAVVVVAAVVGTLLAVLTTRDVDDAPGTGGRRLAVPSSIEGYRPIPNVNTDDLKANLGQQLSRFGAKPDDVVRHGVVVALEQLSSGNRIAVVGIALRDIPRLQDQVRSDGVESNLKSFLAAASRDFGAASRTTAYSPGPRKGFLRCTSGTTSGTTVSACAWGDQSAFALTIVNRVGESQAAAITRELRAKIESP